MVGFIIGAFIRRARDGRASVGMTRAPSMAELSSAFATFASMMTRATVSETAIEVASEAVVDGAARGGDASPRDVDAACRAIERAMIERGRRGRVVLAAFDVFKAIGATRGRCEGLDRVASTVAERGCEKFDGDADSHVSRALEALRFYVLDGRDGYRSDGRSMVGVSGRDEAPVVAAISPALRFARKLLDSETSREESLQAALFLAAVCVVHGHINGIDDEWRVKAREVLDSSSISIGTLVGPRAKYLERAVATDKARCILRTFAHVTAPVLPNPSITCRDESIEHSNSMDADPSSLQHVDVLFDNPITPLRGKSKPSSESQSPKSHDMSKQDMDVSFAVRQYFKCALEDTIAPGTPVSELFSYQIDVMCAYAKDFCATLSAMTKWVRACRKTLRRGILLKLYAVNNRWIEHDLRTTLDANVSALTSLTRLVKMVGARELLLANKSVPFITVGNVESWMRVGFSLVKVAARKQQSLAAFAVVICASHKPSAQHFGTATSGRVLPLRLAFLVWSRMVNVRRANAKERLFALVHYEVQLMRKAFKALCEFAPYHRQLTQELVRTLGLRWRKNAHEARRLADEPFGKTFDEHVMGPSTSTLSQGSTPSHTRQGSISWSPLNDHVIQNSMGKSRSFKTRSAKSRSSHVSFDDAVDVIPVAAIEFTQEQSTLHEVFQAWIDFTLEQRFTGPSLVSINHRNNVLMRKSFTALRKYVVRSVGVREKAVIVENAVRKLEFMLVCGAAFRKWVTGVRYIKRLYAFVDGEVERWRSELRISCFCAWRDIAASGAHKMLWEEQMLADVVPKLDMVRRKIWLRVWISATHKSLEERLDDARAHARSNMRKTVLYAWKSRVGELVVKRLVEDVERRLSAL